MNEQENVLSNPYRLNKATKLSLSASLGLGLLVISLLILLLFSLGRPQIVLASHPAGLEINLLGTSLFFMDSNAFCSTSANQQGPDGLWLPVVVTNTTLTETYTGLQMTFSPSISTTADDPVRYLGNLGPGESISVFYFVDYRELRDHPSCSNGIDGWFSEPYTLTVTSVDNSLTGPASFTDTFDSVSMISANAGGLLISDTIGPGAAVGQVLTQTAVYKFGNNPTGSQLFLQPAGNGDFNDECFRLVGSEILSSDVTGVPVGAENILFFPNTDTANPDEISVQYEWLVLCSPGVETQTFPWAEITSGTQFKYNGSGYGPATNPLPNPVTDVVGTNKSVSPPILPTGGTVTYTVEFANSYTQTVYLLQITDTLDPGIEYMGMVLNVSDILPSNSTISPTIPATGTLRWYSIPFPNNTASYAIPPSGSIFLVYTATVTNTLGLYDNTVLGVIGQEIVGPASTTVQVGLPPNLSVTKIADTPIPLQPGDPITYSIVISNSGGDATGVTVSDTIPLYTSFVPGSVTISPSSAGGTPGLPPIIASDIMLAGNSLATVTYQVIVDNPLPAGVENIVNTAAITSTEVPTPTTTTVTNTVVDPRIALSKEVVPPGVVNGMVTFTIRLTNTGSVTLGVIPLIDRFMGPVSYVGGTPPADAVDSQASRLTWNDLTTSFGDMVPGQVFLVDTVFTLTTSVNNAFTITNVATVTNVLDVFNNPANEDNDQASLVNTPTAVDLLYFQVGQQGQYVLLSWATAVEFDNFGFRLLRSPTGDLADAVEIAFIPGQGHGQNSGSYYTYLDKSVHGGETYSYWLVDVDFFGLETVHGPETIIPSSTASGGDFTLFLPLIVK